MHFLEYLYEKILESKESTVNLITKIQKEVLLDQAARTSILNSNFRNLAQILTNLIGPTDIGQQTYGSPLTPLYYAVDGAAVSIPKISNYFTGLSRDLKVADLSLTDLETDLENIGLEFWARIQLLTNSANNLQQQINYAKLNLSNSNTWSITETFANTNNIDMPDSTVWVDTSEGSITIPTSNSSLIVNPDTIVFTSQTVPTGGSFLSSTARDAFDSQYNTNWICMFTQPGQAQCVIGIPITYINTITITPLSGINILIDSSLGGGVFTNVINDVIYSKTTYIIDQSNISSLRFSFSPANATLPVTCGITEIVMYTSTSETKAVMESVIFNPTSPFTTVKMDYVGTVPSNTLVNLSYNVAGSGGPWNQLVPGQWTSISDSSNTTLYVSPNQATANSIYRGLYGIPVGTNPQPLTTGTGQLQVGLNQMQVQSFYKDWRVDGLVPKILGPDDFQGQIVSTTWAGVDSQAINTDQFVVQQNNQTEISGNPLLSQGGQFLFFQRPITYVPASPTDNAYQHMCIVPLQNAQFNSLQYTYNYSFSYQVFCPNAFTYSNAKYWFYQGFRKVGSASYRNINKSFASFSMYINGILVAGTANPYTIYSDNSFDAAGFQGVNFPLSLQQGWNTIEMFMNVVNPNIYASDGFDSAFPYVQIYLTPSLFDPSFQNSLSSQISALDGSGVSNPISEFDLLWNAPASPVNWAWSTDRTSLLFNVKNVNPIDGYFTGVSPNCVLTYQGTSQQAFTSIQAQIGLDSNGSRVAPILNQYTLQVR